jgi:hypothetical protein
MFQRAIIPSDPWLVLTSIKGIAQLIISLGGNQLTY